MIGSQVLLFLFALQQCFVTAVSVWQPSDQPIHCASTESIFLFDDCKVAIDALPVRPTIDEKTYKLPAAFHHNTCVVLVERYQTTYFRNHVIFNGPITTANSLYTPVWVKVRLKALKILDACELQHSTYGYPGTTKTHSIVRHNSFVFVVSVREAPRDIPTDGQKRLFPRISSANYYVYRVGEWIAAEKEPNSQGKYVVGKRVEAGNEPSLRETRSVGRRVDAGDEPRLQVTDSGSRASTASEPVPLVMKHMPHEDSQGSTIYAQKVVPEDLEYLPPPSRTSRSEETPDRRETDAPIADPILSPHRERAYLWVAKPAEDEVSPSMLKSKKQKLPQAGPFRFRPKNQG